MRHFNHGGLRQLLKECMNYITLLCMRCFVSFTIGTECWQVWCQESCGSALVVLCSLEHMKRPRSIYRRGRVYPVTVTTDSSLAVHVCVCVW